jgi:hypothetical protein
MIETEIHVTKVAQTTISIFAEQFDVILGSDGERYMVIPAICETLGIQPGPQKRRIKRNAELRVGLRILTVTTPGGNQNTSCINIKQINLWLEGFQIDSLSEIAQKKLTVLKNDLVPHATQTFLSLAPEPPFNPPQANLSQTERDKKEPGKVSLNDQFIAQQLIAKPVIGQITLPITEQQLLKQLAHTQQDTHLVVTNSVEDVAFRESCLAALSAWNTSSTHPHFISSDKVTVYLDHPSQMIEKEDARERISKLGERTVMTARIALGLWNLRRHNPQFLQKNGGIPISVEEILEWRGIARHSREAYPGSSIREIEGFEKKYQQQVYEDFLHLQRCYMYTDESPIKFEGPYAHVTIVRGKRTLWDQNEDKVLGFLFAPGGWITSQTGQALTQFAVVLAEIFKLKPQKHQIALRIALYLVERWSQLSLYNRYDDPIMMGDLLKASIIDIDKSNSTRFISRVRAGITTLMEHNILGEVKEYIPNFDTKTTIIERFLSTYITLPPHKDVIRKYQHMSLISSVTFTKMPQL